MYIIHKLSCSENRIKLMCSIFECVSHVKCDVSAISCINFAETSSNVCVSERKISIKKK